MTTIFEDFPFLIPFLSVAVTFAGFVATVIYYKTSAKTKRIQDMKLDALSIEDRAREKLKDDATIAKELKGEAKSIAIDTKDEMMEIIHNIVDKLQGEISRSKIITDSELKLLKQTVEQVKVDLITQIEAQKSINERMEKSLNFVSQFLWGQGAKSITPYLQGMDETAEHKREPTEGIYMLPDSTETQVMKDMNLESTTSQEIKNNRMEERKRQKQKGEQIKSEKELKDQNQSDEDQNS